MKRRVDILRRRVRFVPLVLALLLLAAPAWSRPPLDRLPMTFVPSAASTDGGARFEAQTLGGTVFFTPSEVVLALPRPAAGGRPGAARELSVRGGGAAGRGV